MEISDLYPSFTLTDPWGRVIKVTANESLYLLEQKTLVTPGSRYPDPKPITKLQFALLLLLKIEELSGQGGTYNPDDPSTEPPFDTPDLDQVFGPRQNLARPRRKRSSGNG